MEWLEIWKKPAVRQASRICWATCRREGREPEKEGPRSMRGTVGRREGEVVGGGAERALARRARRWAWAAETSSRIVGVVGCVVARSAVACDAELWRGCGGEVEVVAIVRDGIRAGSVRVPQLMLAASLAYTAIYMKTIAVYWLEIALCCDDNRRLSQY